MATTDGMVREALGELDGRLDHWKRTLVELCRIPSVSASGVPPEEVGRSAQAMAQPCARPSTSTTGWRACRGGRGLCCARER